MSNCYRTETLYFDKGLFDSCVDVTYVITMVGSPRNEKIIKEINKYKPTKKVIIVYNPGFKKCDKNICDKKVINTREDIVHVNEYIFNNSSEYNNILILEDDAEFSDEVFDSQHINNIENFINNNKFNTYSLGTVKSISSIFGTHIMIFYKGGMHAMIYSKLYREKFNICNYSYYCIESITSYPYNTNGWGYHKTLVGQVWDATDNSKTWGYYGIGSIFQPIAYYFTKNNCIKGIENMNLIFKILNILLWLLLLFLLYYMCKKFASKNLSYKRTYKIFKKQLTRIKSRII